MYKSIKAAKEKAPIKVTIRVKQSVSKITKTLGCLLYWILVISGSVNAGIIFSEFEPNPHDSDGQTQQIEIYGEALSYYSQLSLLSIEADSNSNIGSINAITSDISGQFNQDGLSFFDIPDLENPSFILMLIQGSPTLESDLDQDNDGYLEQALWFDHVLDAVGIFDSLNDYQQSMHYAEQFDGTSFIFTGDEPQLVFRDLNDLTLYAVNDPVGQTLYSQDGDLVSLDRFSQAPELSTFGQLNPSKMTSVPEPTTSSILLACFVILMINHRRQA